MKSFGGLEIRAMRKISSTSIPRPRPTVKDWIRTAIRAIGRELPTLQSQWGRSMPRIARSYQTAEFTTKETGQE